MFGRGIFKLNRLTAALAIFLLIYLSLFGDFQAFLPTKDQDVVRVEIVGENDTFDMPAQLTNFNETDQTEKLKKLILFWNSVDFGQAHLGGCPDWNCRIVADQRLVEKSHAVVFYGYSTSDEPRTRFSWQYYVFFTQESPIHTTPNEPYPGFYNLTLGYRRDADASSPYGYTVKRTVPLTVDSIYWNELRKRVSGKTKMAAWFVSNCGAPSHRDRLVGELQKYLPVDVYGSCGPLKCPHGERCQNLLNNEYKFYFAFENSVCKDYATEKFWEKIGFDVLVVVLKRSAVEHCVPEHSFIAADDFDTVKQLADHLLRLNEDRELYLEYFKWKLSYEVIFLNGKEHDLRERPWGFCKLCALLNAQPQTVKVYNSIDKWWVQDAQCDNGLVDRLLNKSAWI